MRILIIGVTRFGVMCVAKILHARGDEVGADNLDVFQEAACLAS